MRLIKKDINAESGNGFVHLIPEYPEDYWYLYNMILPFDLIKASTYRKIIKEGNTGSVSTQKKLIRITVKVLNIDYFPEKDGEIVIKGKNISENEYINMGQHHSLHIQLNQEICIIKRNWEKHHLELLTECTDVAQTADVVGLVMEEGVAHLCYITPNTTLIKAKIEKNVPKKKSGNENHNKAMNQFYEMCFSSIITHIKFENIRCFIIASPGFVNAQFFDFLKEKFLKEIVITNDGTKLKSSELDKFLLVHSSSGYKDALVEAFNDPKVKIQLNDTKAISETKALDKFFLTMKQDMDKVAYGPKYVIEANMNQAVDLLLITDKLFRSRNFTQRKIYKFPLNLDYLDESEDKKSLSSKSSNEEEEEEIKEKSEKELEMSEAIDKMIYLK